jgi:hypothetical protein
MLNSVALANALTATTLALYVVCRIVAQLAPGFLFTIAQSWFHTFDLTTRGQSGMDLFAFIFGAVVLAILTWVFGYAFAQLYNRLAKK